MRFFYLLLFFSFSSFAEYTIVESGSFIGYEAAQNACAAAKGTDCGASGYYGGLIYSSNITEPDGPSQIGYECFPSAISCTIFVYKYGAECPVDTVDDGSGFCGPDCPQGSLSPDCAVDCPRQEYTYTLNGVPFRGVSGGGTIGYGQSCPEPSYPSGSGDYCIGSPGVCDDFGTSYNEGTPVVTEESTTTTSENPDGSSTTTTETTTSETSGGEGSGSSGSADGTVYDDQGQALPTDGNPLNDWDGDPNNTIDIGGSTYGLCSNGGIVSASGGCDYPSHNCSSGQVDTINGCIDLPDTDLPETPPATVTTTDTDPLGNTTTTTVSSPGHDGAAGTSGASGADADVTSSSGSSSGDCAIPPTSSGDAQLDAILHQNWELLCAGETFVPEILDDMGTAVSDAEADFTAFIETIKADIQNTIGVDISASGSCDSNIVNIFAVPMDFSICRFIPYFAIAGNVLVAMGAFLSFRIILS